MKEYLTQSMFNYLLQQSNGQLLLSPEQLEKVIGISAKQQSVLRTENKFPIKFSKVGKLVFYSISDVIEYLLNGVNQQIEEEKPRDKIKEVVGNRKSKVVKDVSNIFMMKSFATVLYEEGQQLMNLSDNLNKYANSFELHQKLTLKLSSEKTT